MPLDGIYNVIHGHGRTIGEGDIVPDLVNIGVRIGGFKGFAEVGLNGIVGVMCR